MKRRTIILVILIYTFIAVSLFASGNAEEDRREQRQKLYNGTSTYAMAIPYNGAFGVNLANSAYINWPNSSEEVTMEWVEDELAEGIGKYTDAEMIGMLEIAQAKLHGEEEPLDPIMITCSCPQGFEFVSQSNPSYRRPFEIILVPRSQYKVSEVTRDSGEWSRREPFEGGNKPYSGKASLLTANNPETPDSWVIKTADADKYNKAIADVGDFSNDVYIVYQWYDVILNLPGEIDPATDVLTVTNSRGTVSYPLIEGDDYSALVSITIQWGDYSDSVTIPFSGYYDSRGSQESNASALAITPTGNASTVRLDVDQGIPIDVANINFMRWLGYEDSVTSGEYNDNHDPAQFGKENIKSIIFLSSSSNPEINGGEFRFIHNDLQAGEILDDRNSIKYVARTTDNDNGHIVTFDGTMTASYLNSLSENITDSDSVIIPTFYGRGTHGNYAQRRTYWQEYNGTVEIILENKENVTMYSGGYHSYIYVHVFVTGD